MRRHQIPLALAYSMTVNKSQGQEFQLVLFDLRFEAFCRGHLYVGLSRIKKPTDILILITTDKLLNGKMISTQNVVYKILLLNIN